ncbi:hypothetical protein [Dendronalium sp. ChiSLP03b]|uniref:hypothetical protein n=1 Tax=Dendronalium sp. ChiSLP03b TaxID=3075381 RepID=UPI002AD1E755|nr:hypothetical protein [Dendronalium sp. ChiSLP03b]MDZ8209077.1 hypothetical protein [Dendronalium sp. ChiSLP03b]
MNREDFEDLITRNRSKVELGKRAKAAFLLALSNTNVTRTYFQIVSQRLSVLSEPLLFTGIVWSYLTLLL